MRGYVVAITPKRAIVLLLCVAVVLLFAGISLIYSSYVAEQCEIRYHIGAGQYGLVEFSTESCSNFVSPLNGPFALYYKLDGYYQNHKEFRRSIDYKQLFGTIVDDESSIYTCRPYLRDNEGRILHPCGAVPRAVFTDRFKIFRDGAQSSEIVLDESIASICNSRGVHRLFKNPSAEAMREHVGRVNFWLQEPDIRQSLHMDKPGVGEGVQNSHFINWLDISATSTVKKLYGIFNAENLTLPIYVRIEVSKNLPSVVKKSVIIARRSVLGHTGHTLGVIYVLVSLMVTLLAAIAFAHTRNTKNVMSH